MGFEPIFSVHHRRPFRLNDEKNKNMIHNSGLLSSSYSHHGYIKEYTSLEPILYETFQEAMVALSNGEVDALIGNLAVATHTMRDLKLTNLEISGYVSKEAFPLAMAVRKDWPELVSIFNKALDAIPEHKRVSLASKWVPVEYAPDILPGLASIEVGIFILPISCSRAEVLIASILSLVNPSSSEIQVANSATLF